MLFKGANGARYSGSDDQKNASHQDSRRAMQDSSSPSTNVVPLNSRAQADQSGIKNFLSKVPLVPMDNCPGIYQILK